MEILKIKVLDAVREKLERGSDTFCAWAGKARSGKDVYVGDENISCPLARFKLGYERLPNLEDTLVEWMDALTRKEAKQYLDDTITIHGRKIFHLSLNMENPDLIVYFGKPDEIMQIIRDYTSKTGKRVKSQVSGVGAMCGELCALPYMTKQPNLSVGCRGSRARTFKENEIAVAFPYHIQARLSLGSTSQ